MTPQADNKPTILVTPQADPLPKLPGFTPLSDDFRPIQEGFDQADPVDIRDYIFTNNKAGQQTIERKEWKVDNYDKVVEHPVFGKFYHTPNSKEWWTKDNAGHGGSTWKKFKGEATGLEWQMDVDKYGDNMENKHKGDTRKFISWKELTVKK